MREWVGEKRGDWIEKQNDMKRRVRWSLDGEPSRLDGIPRNLALGSPGYFVQYMYGFRGTVLGAGTELFHVHFTCLDKPHQPRQMVKMRAALSLNGPFL